MYSKIANKIILFVYIAQQQNNFYHKSSSPNKIMITHYIFFSNCCTSKTLEQVGLNILVIFTEWPETLNHLRTREILFAGIQGKRYFYFVFFSFIFHLKKKNKKIHLFNIPYFVLVDIWFQAKLATLTSFIETI